MKEIKETISILKARWSEAIVIVSLYVLIDAARHLFRSARPVPNKVMILSCMALVLVIVTTILKYGFLRTVLLGNRQRQTFANLLEVGKRFFWRAVGYGLIYLICFAILIWLTFLVIKNLASVEMGFWETMKSAPLLFLLYSTIPGLILVKVQLLVPAIILVLDCGVFEGFKSLRKWRLLDSKELVALFCLNMALALFWGFVRVSFDTKGVLFYILAIVSSIVSRALWIIIAVTAVRFVGSHGSEEQNGSWSNG